MLEDRLQDVAWEVVDSRGIVGDGGKAWVRWWWAVFSGIEAANAVKVVGADGGQGLGLAEAGIGRLSVVVVGGVLGCFIISPASG